MSHRTLLRAWDTRRMLVLEESLGRLRSDWSAVLGEREGAVVRWGRARRFSRLHLPRGPLPSRLDQDGTGELIGEQDASDGDPAYGFDHEGRIVVARSFQMVELLSFAADGGQILVARRGESDGMAFVEIEAIFLEGNRWVARETLRAFLDDKTPTRERFRYDYEDGRLVRVLSLTVWPDGSLHPRVASVTYDEHGEVALSTETRGPGEIPGCALAGDPWQAVIDWERGEGMPRAILWDGRLDRVEERDCPFFCV